MSPRRHLLWPALCLAFLAASPQPAQGADYHFSSRSALLATMQRNAVDPLLSFLPSQLSQELFGTESGAYDSHYLLAWLQVRGAVTFADRVSLVTTLDSTAVTWQYYGGTTGDAEFVGGDESPSFDGLDGGEALEKVAFVRELYAEAVLGDEGALSLSLGHRRTRYVGGFFHDDYGTGAAAGWDFWTGGAWTATLTASATMPYRYLPEIRPNLLLSQVSVALRDPLFESVEVGVLFLRDRAGIVHGQLRRGRAMDLLANAHYQEAIDTWMAADAELPVDLGTLYGEMRLDLSFAVLHGLAALQWGKGHHQPPPPGRAPRPGPGTPAGDGGETTLTLAGHMVLAELMITAGEAFTVTPFVLSVSGLSGPLAQDENRLSVFVSLVPYVSGYATIALTGGLGDFYSARSADLLGMGTGGLAATGIAVNADFGERVSYGASLALLGSNRPADSHFGGSYGVELDNRVAIELGAGFQAHLELDLLLPGDYFPGSELMVVGTGGVRHAF